jgi:hypothetical protein
MHRRRLLRPTLRSWPNGALAALAVVLGFLGLAERVWLVDHFPINSDQAVVGLMARGILHGHFVAFFWGQHYAGAEPYLTSALFALLGPSDTALNLTPVVLSVTATYLVYRVARYYLPYPFTVLAALAVWLWPLISLTSGTEEIGYVFACLNFGLLAVLFATRIRLSRGTAPGELVWARSFHRCLSLGQPGVRLLPRPVRLPRCPTGPERSPLRTTGDGVQAHAGHRRPGHWWLAFLVGHRCQQFRHRHPSQCRALPGHSWRPDDRHAHPLTSAFVLVGCSRFVSGWCIT